MIASICVRALSPLNESLLNRVSVYDSKLSTNAHITTIIDKKVAKN